MKFEIIGDLSKLEILIALKYTLFEPKIKSEIIRIAKFSESIYIEYKNTKNKRKGKIVPRSFVRDFKIQNILDNIINIDDEIKITTELIKKKLNNN
jgi:hypothetical protein